MSPIGEQPIESRTTRRRTVIDVVELSDQGTGFAYVPGEVLVRANAVRRLRELTRTDAEREEDESREAENPEDFESFLDELFPPVATRESLRGGRGWRRAQEVERPLEVIEVLVSEGYDAQPNHVMFVHGCGSPCPPHPALVHAIVRSGLLANPMGANPMGANPMGANPMGANPMGANPMGANPMGANPMGANPFQNTAVPAERRSLGTASTRRTWAAAEHRRPRHRARRRRGYVRSRRGDCGVDRPPPTVPHGCGEHRRRAGGA